MNEDFQGTEGRVDTLIEDLIPLETFESAAMASILLACRAALRDGRIADLERIVWWFHDSIKQGNYAETEVRAN
ncbi:hypothetical protein [Singulisphaera acidiphila]|uniref:Uncharacterized protein n=1 Tax=Singulisphaera acidiphila (strain ATCC BAA-1392 / DSM 18658 / VKM B-2454 / MOB10) TaxID=886293 RepID=L0DCQ1_SINAD|nr:hypothetical protein [Singulisphaera acidiphila]AGA27154.1 hypothetical protein Sinac_2864 [Singulisphaera acidiphila DSM 18658]